MGVEAEFTAEVKKKKKKKNYRVKRKKKNGMQVVGNANDMTRKGSFLCRVKGLLCSSWEEWEQSSSLRNESSLYPRVNLGAAGVKDIFPEERWDYKSE